MASHSLLLCVSLLRHLIKTAKAHASQVVVFSATAILLESVYGKCLRYTEDFDVVFTKNNSPLTLERG